MHWAVRPRGAVQQLVQQKILLFRAGVCLCQQVGLNLLEEDIITVLVLSSCIFATFLTKHADLQEQHATSEYITTCVHHQHHNCSSCTSQTERMAC